ncbi:MAG TPA: thioredoxin family protein [Chitinophagaceae bacterium]|jgi:thiol:disulfide interchange protein DsbD|nr:thioredoxin family protein [Chitinophagaceae bacterium]
MMRRYTALLIILSVFLFACKQTPKEPEPQPVQETSIQDSIVEWKVETKLLEKGKYELTFTGNIKGDWRIYAPAVISGTEMVTLQFPDSAITQEGGLVNIAPTVDSMSALFGENVKLFNQNPSWKTTIVIKKDTVPAILQGSMIYNYGSGDVFLNNTYLFKDSLEGGYIGVKTFKIASIDINNPVSPCGDDGTKNESIWKIFILGIIGGLIALLTPCVFPMIPVTVTFFTKRSTDRKKGIGNAMLYGFFIFLIYVLITIPFHIASKAISPEIFNNISTNATLNLVFFAIFIAFALSFFGLYEIGLPSSFANKAGSKSGIGNIAGIFFMAATLAIVSFSCTGPILGTLLTNVAVDGAWPLTAGAAGFGLALGLPFALFAMFPNWLQSLPKSGGWMTNVKVVLGFVELALAVKFFSNADLVKQWGLLKRELFIGLWVFIGLCIVLYLLGKLRFKHDTPVKKFSFIRILFILVFAAMTAYLVPGLTNTKYANLKLISGFPPPLCYSLYADPINCKRGMKPMEDYELALAKAKKENKPLLIDFTGWACVNCRRMEENVWTDPTVDSLMHKEFVVVSLYVDERKRLPLHEQTVVQTSTGEKSIVTVGDKWSTFQTENFGATSQPQYAIISPEQIALTKTKYYTPSAGAFADWLICGLETFRKQGGRNIEQGTGNIE